MRVCFVILGLLIASAMAFGQSEPQGPIRPRGPIKEDKQRPAQTRSDDQQSSKDAPPGEASSKESKGESGAPLGDAQEHPESDTGGTGEMHVWNPHKADKDVEVGDYHMRRKNYPAAESRYREALDFQNNNAPAMFGLAQALEREKKSSEAAQYYALYLKTLPHGPKADDAKSALQRLGAAVPQNTGTIAMPKGLTPNPEKDPVNYPGNSGTCVSVWGWERCGGKPIDEKPPIAL